MGNLINQNGHPKRSFSPIIDGSTSGCYCGKWKININGEA